MTKNPTSPKYPHYTLLIKKVNGFGVGNFHVKRISIIVPPFWYETIWARVGFGLSFLVVLVVTAYYYNRYKLRSMERENTRLEKIVYERTADVLGTLKRLEESKAEMSGQIYTMSRVLASITHDIQSPLKYISYTSAGVPAIIKNGLLEDASNINASISDLSGRMSVLLGDLMDYIRVQVYGKRVQSKEIQIRSLIEEKLMLFHSLIQENRSLVINQVPNNLIISSDHLLLSIIIHNLLDNASKYTYDGIISINSEVVDNGRTELIIANTGGGISQEIVEMLNSSHHDLGTQHKLKSQKATGLGLLIVKEVAVLLGISIDVTQSNGTRIKLHFTSVDTI